MGMAALKAWAGNWPATTGQNTGAAVVRTAPAQPVRQVNAEAMPAAVRQKAQERLKFIEMVKGAKLARRITDAAAVELIAINHAMDFPMLLQSGKGGKSALTYANYRSWSRLAAANPKQPLAALCDSYSRGIKERSGDERFWNYFFAMYLNQNKLTATVAYQRAVAKLRKEDPFAIMPKFHQAAYRLQQLDAATVILAREGEEAFKNRCMDFIRRDWKDVIPGDVVVCDSRTFDSRVKVWDDAKQAWKAVRPNIAGMMDARSWKLVSYWITTDPVNNATLIDTLALYCVATGGVPPAIAYCDNGSDYCAKGFSKPLEVDGHNHCIFNELGTKLVNSLAYNARAKTIERLFRDMMQQFDKMFADYLGSRPGQRTMSADWFDSHPEELPSEAEFGQLFHAWITEYHRTPKNGEIHQGKSPDQIWAARPAKPALPPERLAMAFLKPEEVRTVQRGPSVQLNNTWYYCQEMKVCSKVLVKSDRLDSRHVFIFTLAGELIGEAMTRDMVKAMALDEASQREAIAAGMAQQRRQLKEAYTILDGLTGGGHRVSPLELFLAQPGAEMIKIGSKASVKGAAHKYTRFQLIEAGTPTEAPKPALEFREDAREEELAAFGEAIRPETTHEERTSTDELRDFHQFITSARNEEDNYE